MKKIILVSMLAILTACGGGGSDSSSETNSVTVSGVGSETRINEQGKYNLTISGTGNDITIKEGNTINHLEVSGTGNDIIIELNTTVKTFSVSGMGNDIYVPIESGISFSGSGTGNELITITTNSIVGTWVYTYPATQCVETYEFNANGTVTETSLDKIAAGTYTFEESVITGHRHLLSITITTDNGFSDCNGLSEDDTGLNFTSYISFTSAVATEWFNDSVGGSPIVVLTKQ